MQPSQTLDNKIKTGVGVNTRNFKKAVDRNYIKRLLREIYRTEKTELVDFLNQHNKRINLFLLFVDKVLPEYNLLKPKMQQAIKKLIHFLHEPAS